MFKKYWFILKDCCVIWLKRDLKRDLDDKAQEGLQSDLESVEELSGVPTLQRGSFLIQKKPNEYGAFLVDDAFTVFYDKHKRIITLRNRNRRLILRSKNNRDFTEWARAIAEMYPLPTVENEEYSNPGKAQSIESSSTDEINCSPRVCRIAAETAEQIKDYEQLKKGKVDIKSLRHQPHNAGFPLRMNNWCIALIGGQQVFYSIALAVACAQSEILITDWWMLPDVKILHSDLLPGDGEGIDESAPTTLKDLLMRKAKQKVKVRIMVYDEFRQILPQLRSKHVLETFEQAENIEVMRHAASREDPINMAFSHHEKVVVVDQRIAFTGGLDLCLGRFDTSDPTDIIGSPLNSPSDWYNPRIESDVRSERHSAPRMPWQDAALMYYGKTALDVAFYFGRRWNHHIKPLKTHRSMFIPRTDADNRWSPFQEENGVGLPDDLRTLVPYIRDHIPRKSSSLLRMCFPTSLKTLIPGLKETDNDQPYRSVIQVLCSASMWSMGLLQKEDSIQNAMKEAIDKSEHFIYIENQFFLSLAGKRDDPRDEDTKLENGKRCMHCRKDEDTKLLNREPENDIGSALFRRLERAIRKGRKFKAVIVLPLLPEEEDGSKVMKTILYWQLRSLFIGTEALVPKLRETIKKEFGSDIDVASKLREYIGICSLAQTQRISATALPANLTEKLLGYCKTSDVHIVLEQIYVHSKILIVDDRFAIVGSANVNDRSLMGDRDSEVSVRFGWMPRKEKSSGNDTLEILSGPDEKPLSVSAAVHDFRVRLWNKHLGDSKDLENPWKAMMQLQKTADKHTELCIKRFGNNFRNEHLHAVVAPSCYTNAPEAEDVEEWSQPDSVPSLKVATSVFQKVVDVFKTKEYDESATGAEEGERQLSIASRYIIDNEQTATERIIMHAPAALWRSFKTRDDIESMLPTDIGSDIFRGVYH